MREERKVILTRDTGWYRTDGDWLKDYNSGKMTGKQVSYFARFDELDYLITDGKPRLRGHASIKKVVFNYDRPPWLPRFLFEQTHFEYKTVMKIELRGYYVDATDSPVEAITNVGLAHDRIFNTAMLRRVFSDPESRLDTAFRDFVENAEYFTENKLKLAS